MTIRFFAHREPFLNQLSIVAGDAVTFQALLHQDIDLSGCTALRLDIQRSQSSNEAPLATSAIANPVGGEFSFDFTSGETNFSVSSVWLVLSAYYPGGVGIDDDNIDALYVANVAVTL